MFLESGFKIREVVLCMGNIENGYCYRQYGLYLKVLTEGKKSESEIGNCSKIPETVFYQKKIFLKMNQWEESVAV